MNLYQLSRFECIDEFCIVWNRLPFTSVFRIQTRERGGVVERYEIHDKGVWGGIVSLYNPLLPWLERTKPTGK